MEKKGKVSRKKMVVLLIILAIFFIISAKSSSYPTGKGEITKVCMYLDETLIEGAEVYLEELGLTQFTGSNGETVFLDLEAGTYTIYVDIDGDGVWDGDADVVVLEPGASEVVINWFPLPTVGLV